MYQCLIGEMLVLVNKILVYPIYPWNLELKGLYMYVPCKFKFPITCHRWIDSTDMLKESFKSHTQEDQAESKFFIYTLSQKIGMPLETKEKIERVTILKPWFHQRCCTKQVRILC